MLQLVSTKWGVLQAVASVFDPLGYFYPTILEAKLFISELWTNKYNWDDKLDDRRLNEWIRISINFPNIKLQGVLVFLMKRTADLLNII